MKKITINKINENIYYDKLDNGLEVYLYVNNNFHNNYVTFTTKYGSIYNEFKIGDKLIKIPNGVAHFLEHKVFEEENDPQPEEYYASNGGFCNAWTTFRNTSYLFSATDNVINNVKYLLDFVQNIYLTDENIESEKGIITQEINMCNDRPGDILAEKVRLNTLKTNPFKDSIIGTVDDVNSITKEMLINCYNSFYHPENMFLVVCGNFSVEEMIKAIRENQDSKNFSKFEKPKLKKIKECDDIVLDREVIKIGTNIPKIAYSLKIPVNVFSIDKRKLNIYMHILFNILFGDTSIFDEKMKKEGIITNSLFCEILNVDTHFIVSLVNNCDRYEELIKEIDNIFKNIKIDKNEFERKKKVLISNEIFCYEDIEAVNENIIDNILFDGKLPSNIIDILENLTIDELNDIISKIDFSKKSIVILEKE